MDVASFLVQKVSEREKIRNIILFGSVARGEADKTSDVDLFVDVTNET
ncbi:nucleotidyltransferase domain-containing protein, partial [Candidatus Woesearchaeota archaeon]|nr:nucleotidyltransferase domain-containing protein [Candidatus Woesearchaeota archaeon]